MFYGVSGHGKGLVDAVSAFGVKNPIQRAVWTENFSYKKAGDVFNYLVQHFEADTQKSTFLWMIMKSVHIKIKRNPLKSKAVDLYI